MLIEVIVLRGMRGGMSQGCGRDLTLNNHVVRNPRTPKLHACHIFREGFRGVSYFWIPEILAILCRADSIYISKDLRKVLLGFEPTGHSHVQYPRSVISQHRLGPLNPLAQNELVRSLPR